MTRLVARANSSSATAKAAAGKWLRKAAFTNSLRSPVLMFISLEISRADSSGLKVQLFFRFRFSVLVFRIFFIVLLQYLTGQYQGLSYIARQQTQIFVAWSYHGETLSAHEESEAQR